VAPANTKKTAAAAARARDLGDAEETGKCSKVKPANPASSTIPHHQLKVAPAAGCPPKAAIQVKSISAS